MSVIFGVDNELKIFPVAIITIFVIITSYHILTVFCDHRECSFLLRGSRNKIGTGARNEPNLPAGRQGKGHFFCNAPRKKRGSTLLRPASMVFMTLYSAYPCLYLAYQAGLVL